MITRIPNRAGILLAGLCAAALGIAGGFGGCGLSKPFPEKNLYAIDTGRPATAPASAPATLTIRITPVRIAKPFDGQTFVYKLGAEQYRVDYYNGFIAPPDRLLSGQLVAWISDAGVAKYAVASGSSLDCAYTLETNVTALYCDYTQARAPRAVVEVTCILIADDAGGSRLAMQKKYRQEQPLSADSPDQLAAAFGRAFHAVFTQLTDDLGKVH